MDYFADSDGDEVNFFSRNVNDDATDSIFYLSPYFGLKHDVAKKVIG